MTLFLGSVLPYIATAVAAVGLAWRTGRWLRRAVPYPLTLLPEQVGAGAVAGELIRFRSLYRGAWGLWPAAWLMHAALAVIVLGHAVGIASAGEQFTLLGASATASRFWSAALGAAAGLLFAAALIVLLLRRVFIAEVRWLSSAVDYFEPALLLAIALSGLAMRLGPQAVDLAVVQEYLAGLFRFRPVSLPQNGLLVTHFTLVNLLLLWLPFSKLVHVTGALVGRAMLAARPPMYPSPGRAVDDDVQADRTMT